MLIARIRGNKVSEDNIIIKTSMFNKVFDELSVSDDDIVMRGSRLLIPESMQTRILELAHDGHQGLTKTKQLLRSKVWFVGIDKKAEEMIDRCESCQVNSKTVNYEKVVMSEMPGRPWEKVSMDFYGPFQNCVYLLVVTDDYSRYPTDWLICMKYLPELHEIYPNCMKYLQRLVYQG